MLLVGLMAVALVIVAVALPLTSGQERGHKQNPGSANKACQANDPGALIAGGNRSEKAGDAAKGKCDAGDAADEGGEGLGPKAGRWSAYLAAATFSLAAIGGAFAVLGAKSTRQSSRARVLVQLVAGSQNEFEIRNLGPTAAMLKTYTVLKQSIGADEEVDDLHEAVGDEPKPFRRTLEPGKSVALAHLKDPVGDLVIVVEFEDVFAVPRRAWRCFKARGGGDGYEEGQDGELPGPWWVD
jgi:hypothetical protein